MFDVHFRPLCRATIGLAALAATVSPFQPEAAAQTTTEVSLPPISVTEEARPMGYTVPVTRSATKTDTPLSETPVSVTVLSRQLLDDQQVITLKDALRNDSSVQSSGSEFYDTYLLRGFDVNAVFRDGLKTERLNGTIDTAFVDRIEIIRGAESFLYGRIEPGGLVNVVTKQPETTQSIALDQQIGSWSSVRTVADATGPITRDGSLLYRAIAVIDRADSWVDFDRKRDFALSGTLAWRPDDRLSAHATVEFYDKSYTSPAEQQIPVIGGTPGAEDGQILAQPRRFTAGDPALGELPTSQIRSQAAFGWSWEVSDGWTFSQNFLYLHSAETQNIVFLTAPVDSADPYGAWERGSWLSQDWTRDSFSNALNLEGRLHTAGLDHQLLAGFDWYEHTDVQNVHCCGPDAAIPDLTLRRPAYGGLDAAAIRGLPVNFHWRNYLDDFGLYLQDQISLDQSWFLILSGRYDWAYSAYPVDSSTGQYPLYGAMDQAFTPRVGLLYKFGETASFYASYSESFGSDNFTQAEKFAPQTSQQYEVGAKAAIMNGALTGTLAYFDIRKQNVPYSPFPGLTLLTGEAESQGVELAIIGEITANLRLTANYTYDLALVTKDSNGNQGHRFAGVPRHALSAWTVWDSAPGGEVGWKLGGGVDYRGRRDGNPSNEADWVAPSYITFGLMAGYRTILLGTPLDVQLNVRNLLDRTYIDRAAGSTAGGDFAVYGEPRSFLGTVKVRF